MLVSILIEEKIAKWTKQAEPQKKCVRKRERERRQTLNLGANAKETGDWRLEEAGLLEE